MRLFPCQRPPLTLSLPASALLLFAASTTQAGSSTYIGGSATPSYSNVAIWDNGVPGIPTGTGNPTAAQQSADIATFDNGTVTVAQALALGQNYSLGGIHFVAGAAAYTVTDSGSSRFFINTGGSVLMDAGVTTAQSLARTGMIVGAGGGTSTTYENDSTTTAATLTTTSFFNANAGSGTVILTGSNTGANTFANSSNAIADGSSPLSFIKNGTGTWIIDGMSQADTFTGGVTINNGTLRIGSGAGGSATNPTALGTGTLTINGGTLTSTSGSARTLSVPLVLGASASFGDAIQVGTISFTGTTVTLAANTTLTANQATSIAGAIGDGGSGTGFGLTKSGAANLTLGAQGTYRGGTTVAAGMLTVAANGALGTGNVTINGGTLTLAATVTDGIADSAVLSLASGSTINLLGTTSETVNNLFLGGVAQGPGMYNSNTNSAYITGTGSITVLAAAVPEPGTWALGLLGSLVVFACLRFRKQSLVA